MKRQRNLFFEIAYLAMALPMFYLSKGYVSLPFFDLYYKYLLGIGIILLAVVHFLFSADLRSAVRSLKDAMVLISPYLFMLLYSLILWGVTMADLRVMTRGVSYILYQVIAILAAAGALYMFGHRGIYLQLLALVGALALVAAEQIQLVGLGEFIRQYVVNILSFTKDSGYSMRVFEKGEYCYAVGFFLAYFILTMKEKRSHILLALATGLLFFLGLKRSALLGISGGIVLGLIIGQFKNPRVLVKPLFLALTLFATGYIVWVYNGLFDWLEKLGVTTSGRNMIYSMIKEYYQMSPLYLGKGAGFVARSFFDGSIDVTILGFTVGDIHNDYLRQYIEFGFFGYLFWLWMYTSRKVNIFFGSNADTLEKRRGVMAFAMTVVACATFLTENSLYCYGATLCMAVTVMGYRYEEAVEQTKLPGESWEKARDY